MSNYQKNKKLLEQSHNYNPSMIPEIFEIKVDATMQKQDDCNFFFGEK